MTLKNIGYSVFEYYYCKSCVEYYGIRKILVSELNSSDTQLDIYSRMIARQKAYNSAIRIKLSTLKDQRENHLVEVDSEFDRTTYKERQLKKKVFRSKRSESFETRENCIEKLMHSDRRAMLEVSFYNNSHFKVVLKWQGDVLERLLPKYNKSGVKSMIDSEERSRVPWKEILSGKTWSSEINLSPYYIYDSMVPNNVVPIKRKA